MNPVLHPATLLILLVVLAPVAAAQPAALADLTASRLEGSGLAVVQAATQAVVYRSAEDEDRVDFSLELDADRLEVSVDHAQSLASAAGASVEGYLWTDNSTFTSAALLLDAARPHFKVEVLAVDGGRVQAEHTTSCLSLTVPGVDQVEASKRAQSARPIPSVPTAGTVEAGLCPGALSVVGDFLLVLWESDVTIASADGRVPIHTGEGMGQARGPEGATAPADVPQKDQAYIHVTGGHLALQSASGSGGAIQAFVHQGDTQLDGLLRASNARGHILGLSEDDGGSSEVDVEGHLDFQMSRGDSGILAQVFGKPSKLTLDGAPVALSPASVSVVEVVAAPRSVAAAAGILTLGLAGGIL